MVPDRVLVSDDVVLKICVEGKSSDVLNVAEKATEGLTTTQEKRKGM